LGCVLYELAFGKRAFEDDKATVEYAESRTLNLPSEDLGNWNDRSKTLVKQTIGSWLALDDILRPPADQCSTIMSKIKEETQEHRMEEV